MQFKTYDEAMEHLFPNQFKEEKEKEKKKKTIKKIMEETATKIMEKF